MEELSFFNFHNIKFSLRFIVFLSLFVVGMILQLLCFNITTTDSNPSTKLTYGTRDLTLTHPLALITIITTTETNRYLENVLDKWSDHPLVSDGTFEINVIASEDSDVETTFPLEKVKCIGDNQKKKSACLTWETYLNFIAKETKASWYFRATDAAWIDLDNLMLFISRLHKIYDPLTNVVFKGQSDGLGNITSCSSGWLISKAFIYYHINNKLNLSTLASNNNDATDASIETSIISRLYSKVATWDDGYIIDATCNNCQGDALLNKQWEGFPECKATDKVKFGTVRDIISIKITNQPGTNSEIAKSINVAPSSLLFYYNHDRTTISLCYSKSYVPKLTYSMAELRRKTVFVSIVPPKDDE